VKVRNQIGTRGDRASVHVCEAEDFGAVRLIEVPTLIDVLMYDYTLASKGLRSRLEPDLNLDGSGVAYLNSH
jgi:hypothetical protein